MIISFTAAAIFVLAGFIQGLTGFGSALIAMPLLCLFLDVKTAVPLCVLNSVIITGYLVYRLSGSLNYTKIVPLCIGSLPGVYFGTTILRLVKSDFLSICLGVLLIAYALYNLIASPKYRPLHSFWAYLSGFASGAIGAAFSAGGPPVIIYTTLSNREKDEMKATLTGFFAFNSILISLIHALSGMTTNVVFGHFVFTAPAVFIGTITGSFCYGRLPKEMFLKIVYIFLILMGTTLVLSTS